jgi:hypothetical protein
MAKGKKRRAPEKGDIVSVVLADRRGFWFGKVVVKNKHELGIETPRGLSPRWKWEKIESVEVHETYQDARARVDAVLDSRYAEDEEEEDE